MTWFCCHIISIVKVYCLECRIFSFYEHDHRKKFYCCKCLYLIFQLSQFVFIWTYLQCKASPVFCLGSIDRGINIQSLYDSITRAIDGFSWGSFYMSSFVWSRSVTKESISYFSNSQFMNKTPSVFSLAHFHHAIERLQARENVLNVCLGTRKSKTIV